MATGTQKAEFVYLKISKNIEEQIKNNVLNLGDKLPSIREVSREKGISISTVLQAYYDLESKGLIYSKPQSGYYVNFSNDTFTKKTFTASKPDGVNNPEKAESIITKVYSEINNKNIIRFSSSVPGKELIPVAKLNKALTNAMRELNASGTIYEDTMGNQKLRRQLAHRSFIWDGNLKEDDIITTTGCSSALSYCIMSLSNKGDTIAVESPVHFGILQLARNIGLNILELPTNSITGIEIDALKIALQRNKIKLCLLVSNFSNPLGSCMPDEHKKEVTKLLESYNVPLIEDDIYGDIYFGHSRPKSCKTYDESGNVLWCGSVSKTLAPGYRVGWVSAGKYKDKILEAKRFHTLSSPSLTEEAIGSFLENGRYENHLRKFRHTLHTNSLQYLKCISENFPINTKVNQPTGGLVLWIELDKKINTLELYEKAMQNGISIAPGRMFTMRDQFDSCLRLNYGLQWNEDSYNALCSLGKISKSLIFK